MRRQAWIARGFAAALLALGIAGLVRAEPLTVVTGTGRHVLDVEIARDEASRERGLMYRKSLAPEAGMLFEFDEDQPVTMWMKNTYIPLDMLFLSADGRVVNVARDTKPMSEDIIRSEGPARAVLEVPAGTADRLGVAPGAQVQHPFFGQHNAQAAPPG